MSDKEWYRNAIKEYIDDIDNTAHLAMIYGAARAAHRRSEEQRAGEEGAEWED